MLLPINIRRYGYLTTTLLLRRVSSLGQAAGELTLSDILL